MTISRQRKWQLDNPGKAAAQTAVSVAIKAGKLTRPAACSKCPNPNPQAHHEDYSKHLDVVWLCASCHMSLHKGAARSARKNKQTGSTTAESLAAAELAYQSAPTATNEPARLARLAAVRQAVADGWTHAAIAEAMGKSRGWVSQRATAHRVLREGQPDDLPGFTPQSDYVPSRSDETGPPEQDPPAVRPRAIDRFRKD